MSKAFDETILKNLLEKSQKDNPEKLAFSEDVTII